ncbi:MAG: hypothetical protein H7Z12_10660, partial [Rhodospirillaceae bacterium]|nr:hypothetical protein [Rhodospirillales bacterium]
MTAEVTAQRPAEQPGLGSNPPGFFGQFLDLTLPYWNSDWRTRGTLVVFVALTMAQVVVPILVNLWSANLFDAL